MVIIIFILIMAAWAVNLTLPRVKTHDARKEAKRTNKLYYEDAYGTKRLVSNNHMCWLTKDILVDAETKEVIYNYKQDYLDEIINAKLNVYNSPAKVKAVMTGQMERTGIPTKNSSIWVEKKTDKPYFLLEQKMYEQGKSNRYYKLYFKKGEPVSSYVRTEYVAYIFHDIDNYEANDTWFRSYHLDPSTAVELTKEEFDKWNIRNYI